MHFTFASMLALSGLASAAAVPKEWSVVGNWSAELGFVLPEGPWVGLYEHVVDKDNGTVTTTYLGDSTDDTAIEKRTTVPAQPSWPNSPPAEVTCGKNSYPADHIALGAVKMGRWCKYNTIPENKHYSWTYYEVAVFVCNWAQTIDNYCSYEQVTKALQQSSAQCGSGFTSSNAYDTWYKAYGSATPGSYVCNQNFDPVKI